MFVFLRVYLKGYYPRIAFGKSIIGSYAPRKEFNDIMSWEAGNYEVPPRDAAKVLAGFGARADCCAQITSHRSRRAPRLESLFSLTSVAASTFWKNEEYMETSVCRWNKSSGIEVDSSASPTFFFNDAGGQCFGTPRHDEAKQFLIASGSIKRRTSVNDQRSELATV